jgi:hypothetical protein
MAVLKLLETTTALPMHGGGHVSCRRVGTRTLVPFGTTHIGHARIGNHLLQCRQGQMRVAVQATVFASVNVRTKVAPNNVGIGHGRGTIMRTTAVAVIASG